ncbi:MAG: DUF4320 family protein [Oscillospiraceae bacterium]
MKRIRSCLFGNSGELAISTSVMFLLFMALLAMALSFFSVFCKIQVQNSFAHEIVRYAEIQGRTGEDVQDEVRRMQETVNFDTTVTWKAEYMDNNNDKIQLGEPLSVTVKSSASMGIGGIININVPLTSKATGRSERYWK